MKDGKHNLTPLYLFVGGFLFYAVAVPCLDSISNVFQSACNRLITHWQFDLNEAAAESEAAVDVIRPRPRNKCQRHWISNSIRI